MDVLVHPPGSLLAGIKSTKGRIQIMIRFDTLNELTLRVTCTGNDVIFTKAGSFIAGENAGGKNYKFEKVSLDLYNDDIKDNVQTEYERRFHNLFRLFILLLGE